MVALFAVLIMVGTGGTLVELTDDLAIGLAPLTVAKTGRGTS